MPDKKRTPKASALTSLPPLSIAFVTTRFGQQFGGAEAYGVELMRELSKRHQVTVIGYEYDPQSALELPFIAVSISDHRSEEHTSELQSRGHLVCRLLLEKKK